MVRSLGMHWVYQRLAEVDPSTLFASRMLRFIATGKVQEEIQLYDASLMKPSSFPPAPKEVCYVL